MCYRNFLILLSLVLLLLTGSVQAACSNSDLDKARQMLTQSFWWQDSQIHAGFPKYNQAANKTILEPPAVFASCFNGQYAPVYIGIYNLIIQGKLPAIVKFMGYLSDLQPTVENLGADGYWHTEGSEKLYLIVQPVAQYDINTEPSEILVDYIQQRFGRLVKPVSQSIEVLNLLGLDVAARLGETYEQITEYRDLFEQAQKAIDALAEAQISDPNQIKPNQFHLTTVAGIHVGLSGKNILGGSEKYSIELTAYPPQANDVREIIKFNQTNITFANIAAVLNGLSMPAYYHRK